MIYLPHHCPNTTIYNFWIHHATNSSLIRFAPPESPTPRRHQTCSNFAVPAKVDIVLVAVCPFLAILPKSKSESLKKQDLLFACFNSYVLPIASSVLLTDWRHQFWSATYCDCWWHLSHELPSSTPILATSIGAAGQIACGCVGWSRVDLKVTAWTRCWQPYNSAYRKPWTGTDRH